MSHSTSYEMETLAKLCDGQLTLQSPLQSVQFLSLDSRRIHHAKTSLFIAIAGSRNNGHFFLESAYQQGVRNFLVEDIPASFAPNDINYIQVEHTLKALQQLATQHRSQFNYPIVGITGSNGKTTVKEWLAQLLSEFNVIRSPKSYNSQIGVPLSIWNLHQDADIGIIEAGVSQPNEMAALAKIIAPDLGIFTSIGAAHQENFSSINQKIDEKLKLFSKSKQLILSSNHPNILKRAQWALPHINLITWGKRPNDFVQITNQYLEANCTVLHVQSEGARYQFTVPFMDRASIENACHALTAALVLGADPVNIQHQLKQLRPLQMRLEYKRGKFKTTLINDYYSADLNALEIALDVLNYQRQHPNKTLIISELVESGLTAQQMNQKIAELINVNNISRVIAVGELLNPLNQYLNNQWFKHFESTEALLEAIHQIGFNDETILIKGARKFQFEKISRWLEERNHETVLEINLTALVHNLNYFKSLINPNTQLMVMVKALSYGTGVYEIANVLAYHQVDYLSVAYVDEGIELRKAGIQLPIMVLSPHESELSIALDYQLEPEIYSLEIFRALISQVAPEQLRETKIHLCLDTGMRRLGFQEAEIGELMALLEAHPEIEVAAIYTHLVGTDEAIHDDFTHQQVERFKTITQRILPILPYTPLLHVLNSGGIQRFPNYQFDMVRLGIGLHGIGVTPQDQKHLRPVARLKTTVSQVKNIKKGESIGYSRAGVAKRDGKTATISIGYADGLNRLLSNGKGQFYIQGKPVSTVGNVCMDMTMLDATDTPVKEGDEVIIFDEEHTVIDLAKELNTIPYEVLTSVSQRVKRIFYHES